MFRTYAAQAAGRALIIIGILPSICSSRPSSRPPAEVHMPIAFEHGDLQLHKSWLVPTDATLPPNSV